MPTDPKPASRQQRRKPRKVSPASLERAALHYLERYSASAEGVRRVLSRRIARAVEAHDQDPRELAEWAEAVIGKLIAGGLLDDRRFAEGRARSLAGRGYGRRRIALALAQKGVDRGAVEAAIESLDDEGLDERATAIAFARRRRLGPFRTTGDRSEHRQRDMAAMARAGFGFGLAREIIEADAADLE
jgi:regulatory protein